MEVFNLANGELENGPDGRFRTAAVGERLGADLLGASVYEIEPGQSTWPYHVHYGAEEALFVVSGRLTLRTPQGERSVGPGEVVRFAPGPDGAHEERNDGDETARFLLFGPRPQLDVDEEPDTGALFIYSAFRRGQL